VNEAPKGRVKEVVDLSDLPERLQALYRRRMR